MTKWILDLARRPKEPIPVCTSKNKFEVVLSVKTVIFCYNRTSVPFWWGTKTIRHQCPSVGICNTCWFQHLHQDSSSHVGDSFSPQTQNSCEWLFSEESKLIAKTLTARAQRQKSWHSSLCIRKSTHVLGSDPSRIPVWNTIWEPSGKFAVRVLRANTCTGEFRHIGIVACCDEKIWGQVSVLQMGEAIQPQQRHHLDQQIKDWACGAQRKDVCSVCMCPAPGFTPSIKVFSKTYLIFKFFLFPFPYFYIFSENEEDKDDHPVPKVCKY